MFNQSKGASDPAEIERLRRLSNRPEVAQTDGVPRNPFDPRLQQNSAETHPQPATPPGQSSSQQASKPRLRSPLLAGEEEEDEAPGPLSSRARAMGQNSPQPSRKHLHSPLLGGGGDDDDYDAPAPGPSGKHALHSPLLGDAGSHGQAPHGQESSGSHLHSPLLGDAGSHGVAPPEARQAGSGKHHLHSPLLGSGDDDDYYEDEAPRRQGGLHSPILGGGGGSGGRGLRSPILGGSSGGGADYYEDDYYDDDPYADEDNPNILRSPLLSAKMPLEHDAPPAPKQAGQRGRQEQRQEHQHLPQAPQPQTLPQAPVPQTLAQPYGTESPSFQAPTLAPEAPAPQTLPQTQPQQALKQTQIDPLAQINAIVDPPVQSLPNLPPELESSSQPAFEQPQQADNEFPDMTQFRRGESGQPAAAPGPGPEPVIPVSLPLTAGIPDPSSYIPPDPAPSPASYPQAASQKPAFDSNSSFLPPETQQAKAPAGTPAAETKEESQSRSSRKFSSKLLADDRDDDNDYASPYPQKSTPHSYSPPPQPASPLPKMLGGVAIFLSLLKLPFLMAYLPAIANPQYTWQVVDMLATTVALIALGLAALMSKN